MTRVLANLLGTDQLSFRSTILELEKVAGKPSKDIRLTTEIARVSSNKIKDLHLDPSDTTSQELYYSLRERYRRDNKLIRDSLSISANANNFDATKSIIQQIQKGEAHNNDVLALKKAVAKKIIKQVMPKKTMRALGYRSLDSMIKHESSASVMAVIFAIESKAIQKKVIDQYKTLQASDFELRNVEFIYSASSRWLNLINENLLDSVYGVQELGAVVIMPAKYNEQELTLVTSIVSAVNEVRSMSSFLKMQQVKPDFGQHFSNAVIGVPHTTTTLMNKIVPWRTVHQYFGRFSEKYDSLAFEPHILESDLQWSAIKNALSSIHPVLAFWGDGFTAYTDKLQNTVSFNVLDVGRDCLQRVEFVQRTAHAMQQELWEELVIRYLDHTNIVDALSRELQTEPVFIEE